MEVVRFVAKPVLKNRETLLLMFWFKTQPLTCVFVTQYEFAVFVRYSRGLFTFPRGYVTTLLRDMNKSKNDDKSANNCPTEMVHIWGERA